MRSLAFFQDCLSMQKATLQRKSNAFPPQWWWVLPRKRCRKARAHHNPHVYLQSRKNMYLQIGDSFFGLDIEEGNACLEALLVGLPGLQQLRLLCAVTAAQGRLHVRILHSRQRM